MVKFSLSELSAIESQLENEIDLINEYRTFCKTTTDPELRVMYQQFTATHQNHYKKLMSLLTSN